MNKKLKIAIIGSRGYPYVYSGYETLVKELSERLVKKKHKVTVYCHSKLFKRKPKIIKGVNLVYTPSIQSKFFSQIVNSFFSFLHVCFSNTDIVLVVNSANGPFGILTYLFRKKTCINVDGIEWLRPKWKGLGSVYFKIASNMATIFYNKIITDSIEMQKIYSKLFNTNSEVIAYGSYIRTSKNRDLIKKWNLNQLDYYLIVGRLIPDNNADLIIKGFLKSKSNKKLVIVGDVPYKDLYSSNLKNTRDDRLIFTGYVNDNETLAELYHNCYVYIHGHEFGGTNPTMIMAMAYSTSILALETVFNREMLDNGKYGLFFNKNLASIKEMINYCEKNQFTIKKYRLNSSKGISDKYKWDSIVKKYESIFYNLSKGI